jgi:DNA-directed RNA polymerase specialized sigma24 family protein
VIRRLRMLLPPSAVEDVAQEVFIAVIRSIKQYREDALFQTWISGIIRFMVADYDRGEGRQPETEELEPACQIPSEGSEA